ncbi:brachyurin-like [Anopheles ziemanni]|uniref:brachyurin-like n=1 Tax=Anopheles coustani TaxID=139045 RepID=UPI00265AC105|nr:brachyurin-like [Anopheles coustani]XP_058178000.1 brachyurin-like [Anopheles ziemanni]
MGHGSPVPRSRSIGMFWTTVRNTSVPSSPSTSSSSFLSAAASVVYRPTLVVDRPPPAGSKVAGGIVAQNEQFPYLVAILLSFGDGSETLCGGSILSDRFVLTAAHCLYGMHRATVIPGQTTIQLPVDDGVAMTIEPSAAVLHPGYDPVAILNDIALLRLPRSLVFSSRIQPIRLAPWSNAFTDLTGYDSIVSGWGAQSNDDFAEPADEARLELRYTTSTVVTNEVCRRVYGSLIRDQQICVAGEGGRNPCQGDSGGPLTVEFGQRRTQVGIVSYGSTRGCQNGVPGVYTRVTSYVEWIVYHTGIVV